MKHIFFAYCIIITILDFIESSSGYCLQVAKCDPDNIKKDICLTLSPESTDLIQDYNISLCANDTICEINDFSKFEAKCIEKKDRRLYYAGEKCYGDNTCYSGHCSSNSICIGKDEGESCLSNDHCGIGLFCFNGQCAQLKEYKQLCFKDTDCIITHGCTNKGYCYPYHSLNVGQETDGPLFCKSHLIYTVGVTKICAERKLTQDDCANTGKCYYDVNVGNVPIQKQVLDCECSYAYFNLKFCPLETSDPIWTVALKILKEIKDVHTERRFIPKDRYEQIAVRQASDYPKFKDVDKCVLDLFFPESSSLSSTFIGISLISL